MVVFELFVELVVLLVELVELLLVELVELPLVELLVEFVPDPPPESSSALVSPVGVEYSYN